MHSLKISRSTSPQQIALYARRIRAFAKKHGILIPAYSSSKTPLTPHATIFEVISRATWDDINLVDFYLDSSSDADFLSNAKEGLLYQLQRSLQDAGFLPSQ